MGLFPMFLKLEGRRCLVAGGGRVAQGKIHSLLLAGASVRVVAPRAGKMVRELARAGKISWEARALEPSDLDGVFLVVAASSSPKLNALAFEQAKRRGVLCNAVDDPKHCDFYCPAVVRRGGLQIAVSTGGASPALARRLRAEFERQFGPEWGGWVERLGRARRGIQARVENAALRRRLLRRLAKRVPYKARG
jgi:precorrin-2 dehydrogenase/sirohydrochlorin ferrochelatase